MHDNTTLFFDIARDLTDGRRFCEAPPPELMQLVGAATGLEGLAALAIAHLILAAMAAQRAVDLQSPPSGEGLQ